MNSLAPPRSQSHRKFAASRSSLPSSPFSTKGDSVATRRAAVAPPPYSLPPSPPSSGNDPVLAEHTKNATTLLAQLRPFSPPESPPTSGPSESSTSSSEDIEKSMSAAVATAALGPVPFLSPSPPYSPQHPHLVLDHDKLAPAPPLDPQTSEIFDLQPSAALQLLARSVEFLLAQPPQSPPAEGEHQPLDLQILRKFYSKSAPTIALEPYLFRLHRFCPMSTAVYIAAAVYLHKLIITDRVVSLTPLSAHRLLLGAIRVASKSMEDLQHSHARFAKIGGCSNESLRALEIAFCYAMDFELKVDCEQMQEQLVFLRQASEAMASP